MRHKLYVCATCVADGMISPQGDALVADLDALLSDMDFSVKASECMNMCDAPNSISFRAEGKAAYLFSSIDLQKDKLDILAFAKLYSQSNDGWIEDATPCGRLRFCLVGRIPA